MPPFRPENRQLTRGLYTGTLACSPFHVRFGKFSLLRPYEKKVEFSVNNVKQDYAMKLGEGGEAFFVFETSAHVPAAMQTSPLVSPAASPETRPSSASGRPISNEPEPLDLNTPSDTALDAFVAAHTRGARSESPPGLLMSKSFPDEKTLPSFVDGRPVNRPSSSESNAESLPGLRRSQSPPALSRTEAVARAKTLSERLKTSNINSHVNDEGDLRLDITGYKSSDEDALRAEIIARQILSEEVEGSYDIGSLIGADENGDLWIYSSEESKDAATKRVLYTSTAPVVAASTDALTDLGYHSGDDAQSQKSAATEPGRNRSGSDSALGLSSPPDSPSVTAETAPGGATEQSKSYAKTLRLTSDQLKALALRPGANPMSFSVNRATCTANMYLWKSDVPIVVSDVDGTITKSDVLGHILNMVGRDWTHVGVAKLYTDIVSNGYKVLYLTSRSVGQADSTRTYLKGINQEGYKLPSGPVIMSPDRTLAALRREVYLRKPEVFKMSCLRDIKDLFGTRKTPFYAGFGNRFTDALSYRSVNIPSTRIFTINSNAEVSLDLLSLNKYKTGYTSMRETVDHFFPPVGTLVPEGGEEFTDFNYWRDAPRDIDEFSMSDSDEDDAGRRLDDDLDDVDDEEGVDDEDDEEEDVDDEGLTESVLSRESLESGPFSPGMRQTLEMADDASSRRSTSSPSKRPAASSSAKAKPVNDDVEDALADDMDDLDLITEATRSSRR